MLYHLHYQSTVINHHENKKGILRLGMGYIQYFLIMVKFSTV